MKKVFGAFIVFLCLSASVLAAPPVRLFTGLPVKGEIVEVTAAGLKMKLEGDQTRTYGWEMLSPGTRFRYEASYRANVRAILSGEAKAARTRAPASAQ